MSASWNQQQIIQCSHLFVFCNYTKVNAEHIHDVLKLQSEIQGMPMEELVGYQDFLISKISEQSDEEIVSWLKRQPYLALSNLLIACAELKIDACPIEGFEPNKYNNILQLEQKGLNAIVLAAIEYCSDEDPNQSAKKVRKSKSMLFEHL